MSLTLPSLRRIAILSNDTRFDVAVPLDDTLGDVLRDLGFGLESGRHVVLGRGGVEAKLTTPALDLLDGGLYSIVDLRAPATRVVTSTVGPAVRFERGSIWWMLGVLSIIAVALDLLGGSATVFAQAEPRILVALALGVAAIISAVMWAARHPRDDMTDALAMLAPLALAFASGFVAIPLTLASGVQFAVVTGLLGSGVLGALLTVTVGGLRLRSAIGTTTILVLGLAAIWGITLLFGWSAATAAAISAGAVPLALRALPSTLVNVPEGYHIDYARFMSNRWSVRGSIPPSPTGPVRMDAVRGVVQDSTARLLAGTVVLSMVPVIMVPIALADSWRSSVLTLCGTLGLLGTLVIALLLLPRHSATPVLRWVPRAAAIAIALEATSAATEAFGGLVLLAIATGLLLVGIIAAGVLVPIGRGASSLGWSRLADILEWVAIALSLPAGLLAVDILDLMRGMMAG